MSEFWQEPCPARGAALSHRHWSQCTPEGHPGEGSGHMPFQCCHCRGLDPSARATLVINAPINVLQRLRDLGLTHVAETVDGPEETPDEDIGAPHEDGDLVEPRAITGEGPKGNQWAIGRGDLTPRQQERLVRYVDFHAWLGEQDVH